MKTHFQNLFYLKKALDRLNIRYKEQPTDSEILNPNLIIPQSNNYDLKFCWNKQQYELVADLSFWTQSYPIENFIDKIGQQYAGEVVIGESQKIGFQPVKYQKNSDGSNTLVLERWNNNN